MSARRDQLPPARGATLRALSACLTRGFDVQAALDAELSGGELDSRDAGLTSELLYGCLRLKGRLDYLLDVHLKKPGDLPPSLRRILELAAFELTQLDRVPAYATLDWAVDAAKARFGESMARLANAVLRNIDRLGEAVQQSDFYLSDKPSDETFLSRYYACPGWIVGLWLKAYGPEDTKRYLAAQIVPPPLGLRLNLRHPGQRQAFFDLGSAPGLIFRDGPTFAFPAGAKLELAPLLEAGLVSRQSAASQLALRMCEPASWQPLVWDACCGRGGKTFALIEQGLGQVVSSDVNPSRLAGFRAEARRLGHAKALAVRASAERPAPFTTQPATILVDAPCSGLGVMARRPDTKWRRRPSDLAELAVLQAAILESAWASLAPGGRLAYITCTLNPEENERRVAAFLREHGDAVPSIEWATPPTSEFGEFFYCAVARKRA